MPLKLCILVMAVWMCAEAASLRSSTPLPRSVLQGFKESELACFAQRQIYYPADRKCHDLPDKSNVTCPAGQWLVLDTDRQNSSNSYEPVCKKKLCTDRPLETFWPANKTCVKVTAYKTLCLQGNELITDKYGEGSCTCRKFPPHLPLTNTEDAAECFELYTRGHCKAGHVLQAKHVKNQGRIAECRPDPCTNKNMAPRNKKVYALYSKDNKCYPLKEGGPCSHPLTFDVSRQTFLPDCGGLAASIFALPPRCSHDQAGDCKKEIVLAEEDKETEAFNLITGGKRKRKRSSPSPKR